MQILKRQKHPAFLSSQIDVAGYGMIFPIHLAEALHRISFISFRHQTAEMSYGKLFPYFLNVIRMKILAGIIIPEALIGKVSLWDFLYISGDTYGADSAFLNINPVYSEEKVIQRTHNFLIQFLQLFLLPAHDRSIRHILMIPPKTHPLTVGPVGNTAAAYIDFSQIRMVPGILHLRTPCFHHLFHTGIDHRIIFPGNSLIPMFITFFRRHHRLQAQKLHHGLIRKHSGLSAVLNLNNP